jgi:hypothetical protein
MPFFSLLTFQPPSLQPIVVLAYGLMLVFQHPVKFLAASDPLRALEPQQRSLIPPRAAGLASEYQNRLKVLTVEDSLQLAAGFFNRPSTLT